MILELYAVFLAISVIGIVIGVYTEAPVLSIGAYGFLFILGIILLFGGVQYKTGTTEQYSYSINTSLVSSITTTNTYTNYDSEIYAGVTIHHILGFLLSVLSVLGFMSVMFNLKEGLPQ